MYFVIFIIAFANICNAPWNTIAGGCINIIHTGSLCNAIGGGVNNQINGNDSVIAGGNTNTVNSPSSSILGGTGNTIPAGMPNTHIVGGGIAAVLPNALHVNGLWANGIPGPFGVIPAGLPVGTIYFGLAGIPGANILYIK